MKDIKYLKDWDLKILNEETAPVYVEKLLEVLEDDDLRLRLANECMNGCKDFSWDRATQEIINMLESPLPTEKELYNYTLTQIKES